jgi:hypothetical protein
MKPSRSARAKKLTVKHELTVEVEPAPFHLHRNLAYLDLDRIAKRKQVRLEIGHVDTDCCRAVVSATVEYGQIVALSIEAPGSKQGKRRKQLSSELLELAHAAIDKAQPPRKSSPSLPVPLAALAGTGGITIDSWTCVKICFPFFGGFCVICCYGVGPGKQGPWRVCATDFSVASLT